MKKVLWVKCQPWFLKDIRSQIHNDDPALYKGGVNIPEWGVSMIRNGGVSMIRNMHLAEDDRKPKNLLFFKEPLFKYLAKSTKNRQYVHNTFLLWLDVVQSQKLRELIAERCAPLRVLFIGNWCSFISVCLSFI
ncbi:MAG: hypothetical protein Q7V19_16050 [Bacteroidales bacterium]|nr:hypothetical protein [Bacteroidales bacterium]